MAEKMNIAVFVDYDNIEIGVKSTLRRGFDVSLPLEALKERGDIIAKFAYANWARQEGATRQMAENAVQMVQRIPSPRGDKNAADINLALDALEMAYTHSHVNAFAIVSGDSDFIPLVNKLKEFGKTVYVVGGRAFTSTILQQNCHEFISYESLLDDNKSPGAGVKNEERQQHHPRSPRQRPTPLDIAQAMPLLERALQVLDRRGVQPQLGLLKSTMLQLDSTFSEKAYGGSSFSDFVDKLKKADFVEVSGPEGRYTIRKKSSAEVPENALLHPEEALPSLRDVLETHRMEIENGAIADDLAAWMHAEHPSFDPKAYGFQEFAEFLNYAQDKTVVRVEPDEEKGLMVYLGAEFYPPALPKLEVEPAESIEEQEEPQPIVEGQPSFLEPIPKPKKTTATRRKQTKSTAKKHTTGTTSRTRARKNPHPTQEHPAF
ncbi:MAG: NYN domain-containing protein [Bryobacteraceae bacterium]|nr:NYN domain-containing protein [Bryobacterales bacterium]MEB2361525.1 NYN domain-containing protein [Bryobacterales bacterium]NUN00204.1 NYN domain-containing protein [Bryobacteraceae bacterium]